MRILVFGAGAVGSVCGGLLAGAGHSVTLLGRREHMAAIQRGGLHVQGIWGEHHVANLECMHEPSQVAGRRFELILLTVKSYDTAGAIAALRQLDLGSAAIVSVQNGYGNTQALECAFGRGHVFGARIITGVELPEAGRAVVTVTADDIRLGPPSGEADQMPAAEEIAKLLRGAGIPVSATDRYREYLWSKILYNCALNPLGALLRATYGELAEHFGTRQLMDRIIEEAFWVTRSQSIELPWANHEQYRSYFYAELIPPTAQHYPSMLRDLERRGRTEIEALNGAVVRLATQTGGTAATNHALTAMIQLREQTRQAELRPGSDAPR
jgi:2-dehydropantoate 2-reductase